MQAIAQRSRAYIAEPHKLRPDFTHQVCCLEESVRGQCRWGTSAERSGEDCDDLHPEAELRGSTFTQARLRFLSIRTWTESRSGEAPALPQPPSMERSSDCEMSKALSVFSCWHTTLFSQSECLQSRGRISH